MNYYTLALKKFADFNKRSTRSEYWYFILFNLCISIAITLLGTVIGNKTSSVLGGLYTLAMFIPSIAVSIRRLHDTNHSGWWILIPFIPIVGFIIFLIFMLTDSDPGDNLYGPNPKEGLSVSTANDEPTPQATPEQEPIT